MTRGAGKPILPASCVCVYLCELGVPIFASIAHMPSYIAHTSAHNGLAVVHIVISAIVKAGADMKQSKPDNLCKSVFRDGRDVTTRELFTRKYIELVNRLEKGKGSEIRKTDRQ